MEKVLTNPFAQTASEAEMRATIEEALSTIRESTLAPTEMRVRAAQIVQDSLSLVDEGKMPIKEAYDGLGGILGVLLVAGLQEINAKADPLRQIQQGQSSGLAAA